MLHPETGRRNPPTCLSDGRKAGPQHAKTFAADTREKTGEDDRRTREHLARAEALGPDIHAPHASPMQAPCKPHASPMQAPCKPLPVPFIMPMCLAASVVR